MFEKERKCQQIFSLNFFGSPKKELLASISESVRAGRRLFMVTPNPEFIIASKSDPAFLKILQRADLAIPDGIGLIWAKEVVREKGFFKRILTGFRVGLKILKGELTDRVINGTDLLIDLCQLAAKNNWSVYLLGGGSGIAQKALENLKKRFPGLSGWAERGPVVSSQSSDSRQQTAVVRDQPENTFQVKSATPETLSRMRCGRADTWKVGLPSVVSSHMWVERINQKKPTLLFVALGMKKQEQFISQNWPYLKVQLAIGVGGAFDYLSGKIKRPSRKWRQRGLEWLYRLFHQPWRFRRQFALCRFIVLVLLGKTEQS